MRASEQDLWDKKLRERPHYTISANALADWLETQPEQWWSVDGDPYLMGIVDFPCPTDELAPEIRKVGKNLLVYDKTPDSRAHGEEITGARLEELADTDNWKKVRIFLMCWADSDVDWLLVDDEPDLP